MANHPLILLLNHKLKVAQIQAGILCTCGDGDAGTPGEAGDAGGGDAGGGDSGGGGDGGGGGGE